MSEPDNSDAEFRIQVVTVTPLRQNASIIWSTRSKEAAVVDPGGDLDRLLDAAGDLGVDIKQIWLTHGHIDHVGAVMALKDRVGCPVIGPHRADQFLLEAVESTAPKYGMSDARNVTTDRFLDEGDALELSGLRFEVLHCPGHSPGHVVFYQRPAAFAFVGDVLFRGSIGRTDLPGGDHAALIRSITEKLWPLGGEVEFLPGHGPGSTFAQERQDNAFVGDRVLQD